MLISNVSFHSIVDVTGSSSLKGDGLLIAQEISRRMKSELGITVSVGVSFNKIFAKIGSDYKKPDAITTMYKSEFKQKAWSLPVADLLYVGKSTNRKLALFGENGFRCRVVEISVRDNELFSFTRQKMIDDATNITGEIAAYAYQIFKESSFVSAVLLSCAIVSTGICSLESLLRFFNFSSSSVISGS